MIHDIRLHGDLSDKIEYFATIAGHDISHRYFFEERSDSGQEPVIRFFSFGSEVILKRGGIHHKGNGGSFCEYMFGGDQPIEDLTRKEVVNRLIMYGAVLSDQDSGIRFVPQNRGFEEYDKIFLEGNAVSNYFFFVYFEEAGSIQEQQETILRSIGKRLKRSSFVGRGDDLGLIHELLAEINDPRCLFFLIRIVHKEHQAFYRLFREIYRKNKSITQQDAERLQALASHYRINQFDQERMKIDVIYKHPENKRIIDEYKDVLIEGGREQKMSPSQHARLIRLRTLCVRNNIPILLPDILDELLLKNKSVAEMDEPTYIQETREIFESLFIREADPDTLITREDLAKLLTAKQHATQMQDPTFDGILMDTVRVCDELAEKEGNDWPLENFGYIVTHFDRYDATYMIINQLAFNEDVELTPDKLRSLIGHKKVFDEIRPDLFDELFLRAVLRNKYLTLFGRKKIQALASGLKAIESGDQTLGDVIAALSRVKEQDLLYLEIYHRIRKRIRDVYTKIHSRDERETLRKQLSTEIAMEMNRDRDFLDPLLNQAILNINKEVYYSEKLFPRILEEKNSHLRDDFYENSGLDRFTLEELEREYYEKNHIDDRELVALQTGVK